MPEVWGGYDFLMGLDGMTKFSVPSQSFGAVVMPSQPAGAGCAGTICLEFHSSQNDNNS